MVYSAAVLRTSALAGPILPPIRADRILDNLETAGKYKVNPSNPEAIEIVQAAAGARSGLKCLAVSIAGQKSDCPAGNIVWTFSKPQDWRVYAGITLWYKPIKTGVQDTFHIIITEGNGVCYRYTVMPVSQPASQWQQLNIPFSGFAWHWEGVEDSDKNLSLENINGN